MSNLTIKRVGELLRSVFEILWDKPDGLTAKEVLSLIPITNQLSEDELRYSSKSNLPRYERIVRLATIPLVHAGWLLKTEKGRWYITEEGYQACRRFVNVQDFYKEAMRLYEARKQAVPESIMVMEIAQEAAWGQIESHLRQLHHTKLQTMLAELLRAMDYHPSWIAPPEKERGHIDLIAFVDPIGAKGQRIIGQIKHRGQAVTLEGIRSFLSTLGPNDYGVIFSIGGFTNEAMQALASGNFQKITSLNSGAFFDLWKQYYNQLNREAQDLLPLKIIYFLSKDQ
ncbi:restriction endonuclease [Candidatus Villigracilis saccharophilus]|uniref:restriction endonuclease n=1 Tax=Candidatus Villigracilis saccharophilus TaxID=3140684 RepID=UPI0031350D0F|nr:Mrr restriction system protein [Anaerolineales bacterium]